MNTATKRSDVIILGGGPAGISAALRCADVGFATRLVERNTDLGGQLLWTHNPITNYRGMAAKNGREIAQAFVAQVSGAGIEFDTRVEVTLLDLAARTLTLSSGDIRVAKAIVIATGIRRRKLAIPREAEFAGRGILVSGARDRHLVEGKTVAIVGGGDAAIENALILSEHAAKVIVVHRRVEFTARPEFLDPARRLSNVEFVLGATVTAIKGDDVVRSIVVATAGGGRHIDCDAVLVRVGVEPNTEFFVGQIDLDNRGYILVDKELRTSAVGVWAIGDVTGPVAMTIDNAVEQASVAVKSIEASR